MAEQFAERVVRFERPEHFHSLLIGADGGFLGIGDDGEPASFAVADDKVIWSLRNGNVQHATTGR